MSDWFKRRICNWPMATILGLSFFLVYLIPPEWIRSIPGMNLYLKWIPANIPGIRNTVNASHFLDIASVYYPLMFLISPITLVEAWITPFAKDQWNINFWRNPWKYMIVLLFLLFIMIPGCVWISFMVGTGTAQFSSMPHNESKFFMALLGPIGAGVIVWLMLGFFIKGLLAVFTKEKQK